MVLTIFGQESWEDYQIMRENQSFLPLMLVFVLADPKTKIQEHNSCE
jgi:hypothetical protein